MKEVKVKLYEFSELSEKVQQKLIEDNREHEVDQDDWFEPITEGFEEDMKSAGIDDITIGFTGFWSQGDGACFHGKVTDNRKLIETLKEEDYLEKELNIPGIDELNIAIIKITHRYEHANTIVADIDDWGEYDCDHLETAITKWARDKSNKLYTTLEQYYEELTSDDNVRDYLVEKGEVFLENGNCL